MHESSISTSQVHTFSILSFANHCQTLFVDAVVLSFGFTQGFGPIWLDEVDCSGFESQLVDCSSNSIGVNDCGHHQDAGVRCTHQDMGGIMLCVWLYRGTDVQGGEVLAMKAAHSNDRPF